MPHPELGDFQPLSAFLTGPSLASKAARSVLEDVNELLQEDGLGDRDCLRAILEVADRGGRLVDLAEQAGGYRPAGEEGAS